MHASMDLLKIALKIAPLAPSESVADALEVLMCVCVCVCVYIEREGERESVADALEVLICVVCVRV